MPRENAVGASIDFRLKLDTLEVGEDSVAHVTR